MSVYVYVYVCEHLFSATRTIFIGAHTVVTNTEISQTDHATLSVAIGRIYATAEMRRN